MDYGEVLTKAWQIIWKFKVLWLFGILAACSGQGNIANYNFSAPSPGIFEQFSFQDSSEIESLEEMEEFFRQFAQNFESGFFGFTPSNNSALLIIVFIVLGFALTIVAFVLGTIGRVGITVGAMQADGDKESLSIGELFTDSQPFLLRAIGLNLIIAFAGLAIFLILGIGIFGITILTLGIGLLCIVPLMCILIPVAIYLGLVISQANVALVVEDLSIMEAVQRGWNVTRENWASLIVIAIILFVGVVIVGFGLGLPITMILGFSAIVSSQVSSSAPLVLITIVLIIFYPMFLFLNGILQSYLQSVWTLTFLRITRGVPIDDSVEAIPAAT